MAEQTKNLPIEEGKDPELAKDLHRIYKEELKNMPVLTDEETKKLLTAQKNGDEKAGKRLVEGYLQMAAELAESYMNQGLPVGDLVQEANVALLLFAGEYRDGDFRSQLENKIRDAIEAALAEQNGEQNIEEEILARVNVLKDISASMAEELGREATVEELAKRMKMTEEEIKDIMKLTLDAMSVSGQ